MSFRSIVATLVACVPLTSWAGTMTFTDFEGFTTGASVDGQGGWSVGTQNGTGTPFDEEVVEFGGNTVWRISNAVTDGAFGNQPFAPRPGGDPMDPDIDPTNGSPSSFAGESSTGASNNRFYTQFDFRSATGTVQAGLSVTGSADNGAGGRQSFFDLEDNGGAGLDITTNEPNSGGIFGGPMVIASGLSRTEWHTFGMEILFQDGADNDVVNYYLNGSLIHTGPSWEQYYTNFEAANHPLGVPVQTLLFRVSGTAVPGLDGGGFYIDNVSTSATPEPSTLVMLSMIGVMGAAGAARRRRRSEEDAVESEAA